MAPVVQSTASKHLRETVGNLIKTKSEISKISKVIVTIIAIIMIVSQRCILAYHFKATSTDGNKRQLKGKKQRIMLV